jgi:hypothetical protein
VTVADDPAAGSTPVAGHHRTPPWFAVAVGGVAVVLLIGIAVALLAGRPAGGVEHRFVIAPGTGARLDAGEQVEIIPAELDLVRGDRLVLVNDDDRVHVVGPFTVRPRETLDHRFDEPGRFRGICTVHPSGEVLITVR